MKVLHLIYDHKGNPWVGGGASVRIQELYKRLSSRHDITVVCGNYPGAADYRSDGVNYHFVGTAKARYVLSTFVYAARAALFVKKHAREYDIVVEDFAPYNPVFSYRWHERAVIQVHQFDGVRHLKKYLVLGIPFYLVEKFYPRRFSSALAELPRSKELFGFTQQLTILPNGFDPKLLQLETEEAGYALFIGRFHIVQKGLDVLRDALRLVNCRFVIVGGGKDEPAVRSLFHDSVSAGQAEFVGYAWGSKKEELLRKCLFMVVPSRHEGQPLIMMDTAACGKPVIVSDIPELRFAVEAGFGLSFQSEKAPDLADKIRLLLGNPSMRQSMGRAAREYAKNFTWDKIAVDYERYLLNMAGLAPQAGQKR